MEVCNIYNASTDNKSREATINTFSHYANIFAILPWSFSSRKSFCSEAHFVRTFEKYVDAVAKQFQIDQPMIPVIALIGRAG